MSYAPVEPGMYEEPYVEPGQYANTVDPYPPTPQPEPLPSSNLLSPGYVPREQGPGMYEPQYRGPGVQETLPPYQPPPVWPPVTEPGMYEGHWERPGQQVSDPAPVEPGMYEPHYHQPGYYAPRSASTYYGGQLWPQPYTAVERFSTGGTGTWTLGPNAAGVMTYHPQTGEKEGRLMGNGEGTFIQPTPEFMSDAAQKTDAASRGEILGAMAGGGVAPEQGLASVGPTSGELGYRYQQGDPGVVARHRPGKQSQIMERTNYRESIFDMLAGLFGGGERVSSQPTPLPPGSRRGRPPTGPPK
jgi:hypothetical protein